MDASGARYEFGGPSRINAEAMGVPGERTFRLVIESGAASASLWLEKEQLSQLAIHIERIVGSVSDSARQMDGEPPHPPWSGGITSVDFKVGKLALGHDSSSNSLLLLAHDIEEPEDGPATLSFWITLRQGDELAKEALKVCAAGRPRCFLCGQPINPDGHVCPRSNGHAPLSP